MIDFQFIKKIKNIIEFNLKIGFILDFKKHLNKK